MGTDIIQNVRAEINDLPVDGVADFPITRYDYILSCRTRIAKTTGRTFTSRTYINDQNETRVAIVRVS